MRRVIGMLPIAVVLAAACGDAIDPTTGGEGNGATGFSVRITDDPPGTPSTPDFTGDLSGAIRVALRNDAGALVSLGVMQNAQVALQEEGDTLLLTDLSRPPADDYTAVELRFEGVDVTVLAGSEVGDTTLASNAVMELGSGNLATVLVAVPTFSLDNDSDVAILVDLNSEAWVTRSSLAASVVPQAAIANSVTVEID